MILSSKFKQTIASVHGQRGEAWLNELPAIIAHYEKNMNVKIGDPYPLTYHYVAPAVKQNGEEVVVKIGLPNHKDLKAESAALIRLGHSEGMVKLLSEHADQGILILEKLNPGTMLSVIKSDETAASIAASIMKKIWISISDQSSFPHLSDWMNGLMNIEQNDISDHVMQKAKLLFEELLNTISQPILLHGDLHQDNILRNGNEWMAIDPKGVIGEAEYEVTSFCKNYLFDKNNPFDVLEKRIDFFEKELSLNRARMIKWGFCQSVLSACWCLEDGTDGFEMNLQLAEMYESLM
jgi:streptomycin 6-kinase